MYQYMELYDCKLLLQMCSYDIAVSAQIGQSCKHT